MMAPYRYLYSLLRLVFFLLIFSSCSEKKGYLGCHLEGVVWGTTYSIIYNGESNNKTTEVDYAINQAILAVDSVANAFNESSEIAILNREGELTEISPRFLDLFEKSIEINKVSKGAFDPSVGPLVDIWGFGAGDSIKNPGENDIKQAMELVGINKVLCSHGKIRFEKEGMRLDFGAIAKGYGVDCVAQTLRNLGINDFLVEIGGEIMAMGNNSRGESWSVQLDAPIQDLKGSHNRLAIMELKDAAVATSGNYRNYRYGERGKILYHTISPLTGYPVLTDILSATIIADNCMMADALATASMVMGLEAASEMIKKLSDDKASGVYGAIFVTSPDDKNSDGFKIHNVALHANHIKVI